MGIKDKLRYGRAVARAFKKQLKDAKYLFESSPSRLTMETYCRLCEDDSVNEKAILYESYFGRGVNDSPHAIFRTLLSDERFSAYQHYWSVESLENNDALRRYASLGNVHFVERDSDEYVKALATCKYLFNSVTFPSYFSKRPEQVYVNTWHGTPMKSMGYRETDGAIVSANVIRNFLHADYLLSENSIMTDMYLDSYRLKGIFCGTILEEGYPRMGMTLSAKREDVLAVLADAGIEVDPNKQIIMYAPTWRESEHGAVINPDELLEFAATVNERIDTDKYQLLIKPHQFVYNAIKDDPAYKGRFVPSYLDTNEILSVVDILISDFSSIVFDYLVLERPLIFYIPELEEYMTSRGLDMTVDDLPGPHVETPEEVAARIASADTWIDEYRPQLQSMRERICPYDDRDVIDRVVNIVFFGSGTARVADASTGKKRLLISGGDLYLNGITRSLITLLKNTDYDTWDVTVFFNYIEDDKKFLLEEIDSRARVIVRCGVFQRNRYEDALIETIDEVGGGARLTGLLSPDKAYAREWHRCLGNVGFDRAVDYNGYVRHLSSMIAHSDAGKTFIWLHNDIFEDMNKVIDGQKQNYKVLKHSVSLFPQFDGIISCGKDVMLANREKLSTPETYDKFGYAHNLVDTDRISHLASEDTLTLEGVEYYCEGIDGPKQLSSMVVELPRQGATSFINIGRMSIEKNQMALIRAFARLHRDSPGTELFILGDGPLRGELEATIREQDVADAVHLTGNVKNPFLFMERADCFVLPSTHEGQPLVVLEARACRKPIIVGDFSTVGGVLIDGGQLLIETDEDSIYEGLRAFMSGDVPTVEFGIDEYNRKVYQEFENAIS